MKLGDIDLFRTKDGWLASVFINSERDQSGFTFSVGPYVTLIDLFQQIGIVTEGLLGFNQPPPIEPLAVQTISRGSTGFDSSKMFLTVPEEDE